MPEDRAELPAGLRLVRTTPEFDERSVPPALLAAHRTAPGVWGRLVVRAGPVGFTFEDDEGAELRLAAGESVRIEPQRPHRVVLVGPARFAVEFYRAVDDPADATDSGTA